MDKKKIALTLGIMCLLLTLAIVIQLNTIRSASEISTTAIGSGNAERELRDEVLKAKEKYDNAYAELERTEERLEVIREQASGNDLISTEKEEELKKANILLGLTEVKGQGVILTVEDNKYISEENLGIMDNISDYLVHDSDLWMLVNELKNAGAEAISINGERIVLTTAITCEGNVVLINGNKISSPFEIKAIGYPESLRGALERPGGYMDKMNEDGVLTNITESSEITIPKYNGILDLKNVK